jgi:gas vesicle structural protein
VAIERVPTASSLIDVLDRVLDKGIVIDAWVRISLVGIDLITVEMRVVVASFETYSKFTGALRSVSHPVMKSVSVHAGHVEVTHTRRPVRARGRSRS